MIKIIDLHCDTIGELQAGVDLTMGNPKGHMDLERLKKGGVSAQVFACFVSSEIPQTKAFNRAIEMINLIHNLCQKNPHDFRLIGNPEDIDLSASGDIINVLIAVENGYAIGNNLDNLAHLKEKKVCYMTLTHSKNLPWAASSGESEGPVNGLNAFGRKVIEAMNEMGMIIDVSHVHESTFWDVIKTSRKPIIASHSNTRAICDTARNLTDEQIRALADNGGMIGINFFPGFLDQAYAAGLKTHCSDLFAELDKIETAYMEDPSGKSRALQIFANELQGRMHGFPVPPGRIIDHICHIADLVGIEYIGFGSDFDGVPALPEGISGSDIYPVLIGQLQEKGFTQEEIKKIAGENFKRILKDNRVV